MFELFNMGGPLFMGTLTIIFLAMLAVSFINGAGVLRGSYEDESVAARRIGYIKSIGLFALIVGVLGQMIGLFSAFQAIEMAGDISPALLAGGFKVSMITTLYGFFIYVFSFLIWFALSFKLRKG